MCLQEGLEQLGFFKSQMITNIKRVDGSEIYLLPFENSDITSEYISWLNDPEVVRFSNQRFIRHTIKSSQIYLKSFKNTIILCYGSFFMINTKHIIIFSLILYQNNN